MYSRKKRTCDEEANQKKKVRAAGLEGNAKMYTGP